MTIGEKLSRLVKESGRPASHIARLAGLPDSGISNVINSAAMPGAGKAIAIARAFGVSVEWLGDESRGWPPEFPSEFDRLFKLLTAQELKQLHTLADRFDGLAVCLAAGAHMLINTPEDVRELAILRMAVKPKIQRLPKSVPPNAPFTLAGLIIRTSS